MPGAVFVCPCLNIRIQACEVYPHSSFPGFVEAGDDFVGAKALDIVYKSTGISILYEYLIHRKQYEQWTVFHCLNCDTHTHAVKLDMKSQNKAAVNSKLKVDVADVEKLKQSPNFSEVYHIILFDKELKGDSDVPPDCEANLTSAADRCHQFILRMEAEMEDRIQRYIKEQQLAHNEILMQSEIDKDVMDRMLMYAAEVKQRSQPSPSQHRALSKALSADDQLFLRREQENAKKAADQLRKRKSRKDEDEELLMFMEEEDSSPDDRDEGGDEDEDENISESDSSADAPYRDCKIPKRHTRPQLQFNGLYSSSMPVDIPSLDKFNKNIFSDPEETPDPDNMGASIMKLAESVTDGSRYIFGERPRPRLNTGDFQYKTRP